jgi:hypothetical protein
MISTNLKYIPIILLGFWLACPKPATAQVPRDAFECLRGDLRADRKAVIAEEMNFTQTQSDAFWPIYRDYRTEVDKVTDQMVKLVLQYVDLYPNVPDQKAGEMLDQYTQMEGNLISIKRKYLKKFGKVLPPSKVFRFAQLDNRLDLGTRVALAGYIPLLPASQAQATTHQHDQTTDNHHE